MTDRFSVAGQRAVVTGGTEGIGRAIAERFVAEGADVAICSRTAEDVTDAVQALDDGPGGDAVGRECDVRDSEAVAALVEATVDEFGGVDCLVNNAGASFVANFTDISENGWESVVDVNLTGTYHCSQAAYEHLAAGGSDGSHGGDGGGGGGSGSGGESDGGSGDGGSGRGRDSGGGAVINLASVAGKHGAPYMSHYGAAKAGVINLTSTLAYEWASDGIRVNCIAPGYVATPGLASQMGISPGDVDRGEVDRNVGTPEEIADVAQFLASDAASFMTGETVAPRGVPDIEETPEL